MNQVSGIYHLVRWIIPRSDGISCYNSLYSGRSHHNFWETYIKCKASPLSSVLMHYIVKDYNFSIIVRRVVFVNILKTFKKVSKYLLIKTKGVPETEHRGE